MSATSKRSFILFFLDMFADQLFCYMFNAQRDSCKRNSLDLVILNVFDVYLT